MPNFTDFATVRVKLTASGVESYYVDATTVRVKLTPSGVDVSVPQNDNFANARVLSTTLPGSLLAQSNVDATFETGEPNRFGGASLGDQSVWYSFTPTASGLYRFAVDNRVLEGNVAVFWGLAVYTGSAVNALTELFLKSRSGSSSSDYLSVVLDLTSGVTYHIAVWSPIFAGETNPRVINFDFSWDAVSVGSPPANDDIADAIDLGTDPPDGTISGTCVGATSEAFEDSVGYDAATSVWYRFHMSANKAQEIHLVREANNPYYHPYFEVWEIVNDPPASFADLSFIDSSFTVSEDEADNITFSPPATLEAGKDYMLFISNDDFNGEWDDFTLIFGEHAPPPNDNRDAVDTNTIYWLPNSHWLDPASSGSYYPDAKAMPGTTRVATAEVGDPAIAGFPATRNVWYLTSFAGIGKQFRMWVESPVDCVLALYKTPGPILPGGTPAIGALVAEDDDSGPGNQPEITFTYDGSDYLIIVDSKTEGDFTLKYEIIPTGTPPPNDDFANAELISSIPATVSGTTVGASAEAGEWDAEWMGVGPYDTVWYKYVASFTGTLKIKATCDTANDDAEVYIDTWRGTTLDNLVRHPEPPPEPTFANNFRGFFNHFDTPTELDRAALALDVVSGQTYYIRVQTESGGSEDFTIYIEEQAVYLKLSVVVVPEVYLKLTVSGSEVVHQVNATDAATIPLVLTPGAAWETQGRETTDATTVRLSLSVLGGECFSRFHFVGEGEADTRWAVESVLTRWSSDPETRWVAEVEIQPGCH